MEKYINPINEQNHNSTSVSGEIIPRHKVKGNPQLFHLDHYESTTLTITPEEILLVDNYFRSLHEPVSDDSPIFEVKVKQKESIAKLIRYFNIKVCKEDDILSGLYETMDGYAREQYMENLD